MCVREGKRERVGERGRVVCVFAHERVPVDGRMAMPVEVSQSVTFLCGAQARILSVRRNGYVICIDGPSSELAHWAHLIQQKITGVKQLTT